MKLLINWYLLAYFAFQVLAQGEELTVPSTWSNSTLKATREERVNRTAAAIDAFIASDDFFVLSNGQPRELPLVFWPYGEFLARIADYDIYTNQTRYKDIVYRHYLTGLQQLKPDDRINLQPSIQISNKFRYAHAAIRAYLAYRDEAFLSIAKGFWTSSRNLTLSDADVRSNSSSAKSTTIDSTVSLTCRTSDKQYTLAGGTFHNAINDNDLLITLGATADYLTLTVSLAVLSSQLDQTYIGLARQMADFLLNVLYKGDGVFHNKVQVRSNQTCPRPQTDPDLVVGNAAVSLQSLSLLALTSENSDLMNVLRDVTRYATNTWHTPDGVLDSRKIQAQVNSNADDAESSKQHLFRSFYELVVGESSAPDLKTYVRRYLAVQYNALVDQTNFPSDTPPIYGPGFSSATQFSNYAQMGAITTLLGGVISGDDSAEVTPNDPRAGDVVDHDKVPVGAIIGGVVGGFAGLVLVAAGGCCYHRRRHSRQLVKSPTVEPYPAGLTFRQGKCEKRMPPGSPASQSSAGTTASESSVPTSLAFALEPQPTRTREATTAELVTLLNQRLGIEPQGANSGQWNAYESPPEYRSQTGSRV
ncbi:hypothetical protein PQX77_009554 [Marasmius sp. AFHP31]|nr:hypothetical protein PQX77_009554 [Marasmius sp. AFHP31]